MKNGIRPGQKIPKKQFHQYFGGSTLVPDFNLDSGLWNPNQESDGKDTECSSYYICDTFVDLKRRLFVPGFSYGATTFIEGIQPTDAGADPLSAMQSAIACGVLNINYISAPGQTELEDANWNNWKLFQKSAALQTTAVDVHSALGYMDPFTSIISAMYLGQISVALCTPFYREWLTTTGKDGIMPMPLNINDVTGLPWHMWAAKGQKTTGEVRIITKPWIGASWGDNGFGYLSQEILNRVFEIPGCSALVFVMTGSRWIPLVKIALQHPKTISYILPQLADSSL